MKRKVALLIICIILLLQFASPGIVSAQNASQVGFFEDYELRPGEQIEIPVEVRDVSNLFAIDIEIAYDPEILEFEDADPDKPGVQPALGTFLDAGLTLIFEVDPDEGLIRFVMTQVNPSEPKTGDGVVLVLYFTALQEGEVDLVVNNVDLSTRFGEEIPSEGVDSKVVVASTAADRVSTPIPVQDPTAMIEVPTLAETPTPVFTDTPQPTPTPEFTDTPQPTPTEMLTLAPTETIGLDEEIDDFGEIDQDDLTDEKMVDEQPSDQRAGFSILRYWWAVLLVFVLAVGVTVYLMVFKEKP